MVYIPPSWVHTVWNVQPCVKLAFDVYDAGRYHLALQAAEIASKHFKGDNAPDCMMIADVVRQQLNTH